MFKQLIAAALSIVKFVPKAIIHVNYWREMLTWSSLVSRSVIARVKHLFNVNRSAFSFRPSVVNYYGGSTGFYPTANAKTSISSV